MSVLQPQEIELPLNLGMATKPSEELQEANTMRLVENLHWRGTGEIEKRPADDVSHTIAAPTTPVTSATSPYAVGDSCGLIVREDDALVVTANHGVMSYSETTGAAQWARRGGAITSTLKFAPATCEVSRRFVGSAQFGSETMGIYQVAAAQYNGIQAIAYMSNDAAGDFTMRFKAVEAETGKVVATYSATIADMQAYVHACEYTESGKEGVLFAYLVGASAPYTIRTFRYDAALNRFVGDSNLTTNSGSVRFTLTKNGDRVYFVYTSNSTTFMVAEDRTIGTVSTTHSATHVGQGVVVKGSTRDLIVSCDSAGAYAEVFGHPSDYITVFTPSAGEVFWSVTGALETRVGTTNDAVMWVNCVTATAPTGTRVRATEVNFDATTPVEGTSLNIPHCWAVTNGFALQGRACVTLGAFIYSTSYGYPAATDPASCFVARWCGNDEGNLVRMDAIAKVCHDRFWLAQGTATTDAQSCAYVDSNDNAWIVLTADPSEDTDPAYGIRFPQTVFLAKVSARRPLPVSYCAPERGVVLVAGGLPYIFDGDAPCEAAALCRPKAKIDVSSGSGNSPTTGYSIIPMYRWVDKAGRLHRMPGAAVSTGTFSDNQIDVYVSICPLATLDGYSLGHEDWLEPELYITADGGSNYYLATNSSGHKHTPDSRTSDGLWFKFEAVRPGSDADPPYPLASATTPEPTPAFLSVSKIGDRVWAIDAEDRARVWYSKPLVAGYGVEWSTTCTLTTGDENTAVVDVSGIPTVLARGGIYQIHGAGPDANGSGEFSPALKLPGEVDCLDPVSVCRTPLGVVFRGRRGFYLLNGPAAEPFGVPIDPEVITSIGADVTARTRVVFQEQTSEIQISGIPDGDRLVYNLLEQKWSRYTTTSTTVLDMAVAGGVHWRLDSASDTEYLRSEKLYSVDGTSYNDDSTNGWVIETPWLKFDQMAGQQRLWRAWLSMALPSDAADINRVTIYYYTDYNTSSVQEVAWTDSNFSALYTDGVRVATLPFCPSTPLCKAFKFKIEYAFLAAPSTCSGPKPLSLRLQVGVRPSKGKRTRATVKG